MCVCTCACVCCSSKKPGKVSSEGSIHGGSGRVDRISPGRKGEEGTPRREISKSKDTDMGKHQVSLGSKEPSKAAA